MTSTVPALRLDGVRKSFKSVHALQDLSFTAEAGRITAVLGPNGAGKTTMIRCCTGLFTPDAGTISIFGDPAGSPAALARTGVMPQSVGAWSYIRADELLTYLSKLYANPQPVEDLVRLFGIESFRRTPYRRLSGGQQQSVNLAAALVGRPQLVFLDEPTAGLDPHVRRHTWGIIRRLRDAGLAVVLTTHSMDEAAELADYVWLVDQGHVATHGTVADLTREQSLEDVFISHTTSRVN